MPPCEPGIATAPAWVRIARGSRLRTASRGLEQLSFWAQVLMRSDRVPHEVLETRAPRQCVVGWFRQLCERTGPCHECYRNKIVNSQPQLERGVCVRCAYLCPPVHAHLCMRGIIPRVYTRTKTLKRLDGLL